MSNIKLSVVIPSYNETAALKTAALSSIHQFLKTQNYSYEVIVVDDKSTNGTLEVVKDQIKDKKNFKVLENAHGGKAITVMSGVLKAEGEYILFTDMDQATPISEVTKFLPLFDKGFDVVIGSRKGRKGAPALRKLAAWGFATLRNIILGLPFKDTQCGFKAFKKEAAEAIFPPMLDRWKKMKTSGAAVNAGFDVETLFLAKKKDFKIAEVEVSWHHVENIKQVQLVKDSIEALKDMLRIKSNDLQGQYK